MGKMMPLKWIEQAEAREVCVIALSEAAVAPELPMAPISFGVAAAVARPVRALGARAERPQTIARRSRAVAPRTPRGRVNPAGAANDARLSARGVCALFSTESRG